MKKYALSMLPLALGLTLAVLWQAGPLHNPIIYLRADLGTTFLLLGFLGTIGWTSVLVLSATVQHRCQQALTRFREEQADAHRRFIRRLDHEFKNPLTAIRAGLANLAEEGNGTTLCSVRMQVDRLARLSADLRKLADLETQPLEREPVDLGKLLAELLDLVQERPDAAARHLRLILPRAPWPLPPVAGDRDLLFLAVHNLVDNALKFSRPGDTVEIRAFEDGTAVVIEVADNGPGISPDELPHLGEELYRGVAARTVEGSGLGLALVQAITARHQGSMTIRSRIGQGTVATLRFPIAR